MAQGVPDAEFLRRYGRNPDAFTDILQVQRALQEVGLLSANLIVGVDFTASNTETGRVSFGGRSLHALGDTPNPYEIAISTIGQCLEPFDPDHLIPCYGFGDRTAQDKRVFSFFEGDRPCRGSLEALRRYRAIVPYVDLAGPTSFAPIIEAAVRAVETSGGLYHVLIIIADGQVTRPSLFPLLTGDNQEEQTIAAIQAASNYPLSIVLVGVGDGPWDTMQAFDDRLTGRNFDNFQFVNLTDIMSMDLTPEQRLARFALLALMEIPKQYEACLRLGLVGRRVGRMPPFGPLPPPPRVAQADAAGLI